MHSSAQRRNPPDFAWRKRRLAIVVAGLMVLGGMVAVTQFAAAADNEAEEACKAALRAKTAEVLEEDAERKQREQQEANRDGQQDPETPPDQNQGQQGDQGNNGQQGDQGGQQGDGQQGDQGQNNGNGGQGDNNGGQNQDQGQNNGGNNNEGDQGQGQDNNGNDQGDNNNGGNNNDEQKPPTDEEPPPEVPLPPECEDEEQPDPENNGFDVKGKTCQASRLEAHKGFQDPNRCVKTNMGEVAAAENGPQLLITSAPRVVRKGQAFRVKVSSRNLSRTRFFGAAAGGYYLEMPFLTNEGIAEGHFHFGCSKLNSTRVAPKPDQEPLFFKAIEDGAGSKRPDTVTIEVPGLPERGLIRCMAWAGNNAHNVPLMQNARQLVAVDVVRLYVR